MEFIILILRISSVTILGIFFENWTALYGYEFSTCSGYWGEIWVLSDIRIWVVQFCSLHVVKLFICLVEDIYSPMCSCVPLLMLFLQLFMNRALPRYSSYLLGSTGSMGNSRRKGTFGSAILFIQLKKREIFTEYSGLQKPPILIFFLWR